MTDPTVLVLGAAGRFGAAAVQAFAAAGWQVLAQQRRDPVGPLPPKVRVLHTALADTAALAREAAAAQVVVYAVNPLYTRWDEELMPLFEQGLAVAEALNARFMLPGNVYNFGEDMPARLSEDTMAVPHTRKGVQRVAMEDELARRAARGLDSVVIRAGDFFGCGTGTWIDVAMAKSIRQGRLVYPGPQDRVHAWAYLPDLARAFVAVAADGGHRGCLRLHFEGHNVTGAAFLQALEEAADGLGLRPAAGFRVGGMPWGVIRLLGWVQPMMRELARMSYLWRVPHALDGRQLQRRVGPLATTPLVAALTQTLLDLGHGPARAPAHHQGHANGPGSTPGPAQVRYR
jgi:nucleoside-diphosphate-sugar epimerase